MQILKWAQKANLKIVLKKYGNFEKTFENVLNAHTPKKTKFFRGNQKPHVDKNFCKVIMKIFSETVEKLNTFKWSSNEKYENIHY